MSLHTHQQTPKACYNIVAFLSKLHTCSKAPHHTSIPDTASKTTISPEMSDPLAIHRQVTALTDWTCRHIYLTSVLAKVVIKCPFNPPNMWKTSGWQFVPQGDRQILPAGQINLMLLLPSAGTRRHATTNMNSFTERLLSAPPYRTVLPLT